MRRIPWIAAFVLLAAASPGKEASGARWTDAAKSYRCLPPEGWTLQGEEAGKAVFREGGKPAPAFLNVDSQPSGSLPAAARKDLAAYARHRLEFLTVPAGDLKPCKVSGKEALRCEGPVGASNGALLDLLAFVRGKDRWYTVMLTCLPKDREAYLPVFEAFLKEFEVLG